MRRIVSFEPEVTQETVRERLLYKNANAPYRISDYHGTGREQRSSSRQRVLLSALVVQRDMKASFRCGIRDVSDEGARLVAPEGYVIPSDFLLIDISAGRAYEAQVAWRRHPQVGVAIRTPMDLQDPTSSLSRRLRTLWTGVIN